MKRLAYFLPAILLAVLGSAQELIRNPAKPMNPQAGRVLKLEPVFTISDASGGFFFKYPYRFELDDQGYLYILDEQQLLQFSPEGTFVRNFYRPGQGPGEIATGFQMTSFLPLEDGLLVYDGATKIIRFDREGKLVSEVKQTAGRFFELIGIAPNGFFMRSQTDVSWSGAAGFKEIETQVNLVSSDGRSAEKILGFPSRIYQGPKFGMDWDNYLQVFNRRDGSLYVSRTCEYQVVRADLTERKIVASFTREYPRAPFVISEYEQDFYKKFDPPKKDFANDIVELFLCGDDLWIKTSTSSEDKGKLFDVFDPKGRFLDSFYLGRGLTLRQAGTDFIIVSEKDVDETILVRKYKIPAGTK